MKTAILGLAFAVTVASMLPAQDARAADDWKMNSGSSCKVFGSTAWTDLQFGARGITNVSTSAKNIICSLTKDTEGAWDSNQTTPTHSAYVYLAVFTSTSTAKTTCNVYTVDENGTLLQTLTKQFGGTANITDIENITGLDTTAGAGGWAGHTATLLCTLQPNHRLNFYSLHEDGNSNNP